ncbi:unnamed protein product [Sphenostylis stenocarpa]|uniref:Uncharacterized protein n=1 Tax=Sphenostylis stenocarpa TaxID=92480 RepID=A0AA87B8X0_9FABA|nr:unnamed protein product [Sphenostylis stenocarpa]
MEKVEMKIIGVMMMVMIVLGSAEAELKSGGGGGGGGGDSDGFLCWLKCGFKCVPKEASPKDHKICIDNCHKHCNTLSSHNCFTSCGFIKSIAMSIGAPHLAANLVNPCLQESELKSDDGSDGFLCSVKCAILCAPQEGHPEMHKKCISDCHSHCKKLSSDLFNNCFTGCGLIKSIAMSIGARDLATNMVNPCMQECRKKQ